MAKHFQQPNSQLSVNEHWSAPLKKHEMTYCEQPGAYRLGAGVALSAPQVIQTSAASAGWVQEQPPPPYSAVAVKTQPPISYAMQPIMIQQPFTHPPDYMACSIVVFLCFNCAFGLIAMALSYQSRLHAEMGRFDEARRKGRAALYVSVAGIILSVIVTMVIISCFTVLRVYYYQTAQ